MNAKTAISCNKLKTRLRLSLTETHIYLSEATGSVRNDTIGVTTDYDYILELSKIQQFFFKSKKKKTNELKTKT